MAQDRRRPLIVPTTNERIPRDPPLRSNPNTTEDRDKNLSDIDKIIQFLIARFGERNPDTGEIESEGLSNQDLTKALEEILGGKYRDELSSSGQEDSGPFQYVRPPSEQQQPLPSRSLNLPTLTPRVNPSSDSRERILSMLMGGGALPRATRYHYEYY